MNKKQKVRISLSIDDCENTRGMSAEVDVSCNFDKLLDRLTSSFKEYILNEYIINNKK